ncbi:MAG: B12-binding domain-containing radical SAM protein [Candidatus Parvarchaeota archaeon]|nr:B12-binding domain-containing radical SAM protein [Candidatus Jingweiarchaeum tengchongense]MCW1298192.1 B12-binding domain-containing radical SAM protein [Candidatus Jingweiarchaeum tengchongense]MCW1299990.1 B12-binding domain-containing radical SAM protein [Candidatus Jingweiarchaeum tengchongense]MCW1305020.1 B12-binding domain-containing radical SAM protein [Candidatus Jingweiarchaeum tengchongense]MCW1305461.1 B12-binding domain-containing radical SAM protein [Candidatus Jingweiarchaeu
MKVLFLAKNIEYEGPIGIMYLSAILKQHGHETKLIETESGNLCEQIEHFSPDLIAYSVTTGLHKYYLKLNRKIKSKFKITSVFGGPHPTYFPEMIKEEGVDVICIGEGELAFAELADKMEKGEDITRIKNLWVKKNNKIFKNSVRPLIADLDAIPFADRELLYEFNPKFKSYPITFFLASRGCPYACPYCFNPTLAKLYKNKGWKIRRRSVDNLIEEIELVRRKQALQFIQFVDSIFITDEKWLEEFTEKYSKKIGIPFYCHVRANLVNWKVVKLLKKANCASVGMGIECGDDKIRNKVLRRNMSKKQIIDACKLIKKAGIRISSQNMFGLPGGSIESDIETIKLNIQCGVDYPVIMLWQPYPRTELAEYAIQNGYFDGDYERIDFSYYSNSVIKFKKGEKEKIENLQKLGAIAVEAPFLLPVILKLIKLPKNTFFDSIFRAWYSYCCETRITPHQLSFEEMIQKIRPLFGLHHIKGGKLDV